MKILLTGSNGQLGHDFKKIFDKKNIEYIATDYKELDITSDEDLNKFFQENEGITHVINCAAYNDVDKAETDKKVWVLNAEAPKKLAEFSKKIGAIFVTYTTDFVFDGEKSSPYVEDDKTNGISEYGKSKAQGEKEVLKAYDRSFVIRTSWVFGIANNNFNKQVINWSKSRNELNIVDDQVSVPTYSMDLAEFSWKLIQTEKFGLYHITNDGIARKYDQAKYVL